MDRNSLNIICFLWNGDRWSKDDQGILYVNKLHRAVEKHLSLPHRFICLTNYNEKGFDNGIELKPLHATSWMGCLPKLCMFSPELNLSGQVLSFDIDVIITGSLDDMALYRGNFAVRSSFRNPTLLDGDIVGWNTRIDTDKIYNPFRYAPQRVEYITGGRERYWYRKIFNFNEIDVWQKMYPGQILSYKNHLRKGEHLPKDARIVSCHGRPRPHELKENWAIKNWRNL